MISLNFSIIHFSSKNENVQMERDEKRNIESDLEHDRSLNNDKMNKNEW